MTKVNKNSYFSIFSPNFSDFFQDELLSFRIVVYIIELFTGFML